MWLSKLKNRILGWIISKLGNSTNENQEEQEEIADIDIEAEEKKLNNEIEKFKLDNIVFDKLNYLQQYIKIFSSTFPNEYQQYLKSIQNLRKDYEKELAEYKNGLAGIITFSIDPENESSIFVEVVKLEEEIKRFYEMDVTSNGYKDKFSKLCNKLNIFYNALLDTNVNTQTILNQLNNASDTLNKIVNEVKIQKFFLEDSRNREELLSYIIYSEYIIFKSYLRCNVINNFSEYKQNVSLHHSLFISEEYDRLIFKFLIEDLEQLQIFITNNLQANNMYEYILESCQELKNNLNNYSIVFDDYEYFQNLIKLENTINDITEANNIDFSLNIPCALDSDKSKTEIISVKNIACAVLKLLNSEKAQLVLKIIEGFSVEISWREFFFICKIFEICDEIVKIASSTIFSIIYDNFMKLEDKYKEYSNEYIKQKKEKILDYSGSKTKKYILLIKVDNNNVDKISAILKEVSLDFIIVNNKVYLNYMYFNGFKNLEQNFGACKTF